MVSRSHEFKTRGWQIGSLFLLLELRNLTLSFILIRFTFVLFVRWHRFQLFAFLSKKIIKKFYCSVNRHLLSHWSFYYPFFSIRFFFFLVSFTLSNIIAFYWLYRFACMKWFWKFIHILGKIYNPVILFEAFSTVSIFITTTARLV